ncbi:hypothetical protein ACQ7NP_04250 [Pseudomonas anuradhapurensis]
MADFIGSFKKGIEAANLALANKAEIDSVIKLLSDQLFEATDGKLRVKIEQKTEPFETFSVSPKDFFNRKTYLAISAFNPSAENPVSEELARWKIAESGYPCKVVLSDQEIYCQDKKALENALAHLLTTPAAGKALQQVMNQKTKVSD